MSIKPRFQKGDKVQRSDNPSIQGYIEQVKGPINGSYYYLVEFTSGNPGTKDWLKEEEISTISQSSDPFSNLEQGNYSNYRDFSIASTYHKIENEVNNTISTLKASRTLFKPHQFKPLVKFLNAVNRRILIADEVGLGKTIEAGHILLEMYARKVVSRVLIICPKSLQDKWQTEMEEKFGFEFQIFGSSNDYLEHLNKEKNVGQRPIYGIITYNKFSSSERVRKELENTTPTYDLLICDEAQALRNRTTNRYISLEPIIDKAKSVIFLSATPINNSLDDLYNLMVLLDPQRYHNQTLFLNDIEMNKPFIKALNKLNKGESFDEIHEELSRYNFTQSFKYGELEASDELNIETEFEDDPVYQRVVKLLTSGEESVENKVKLQRDLSELNTINYLYTRTRKREVEEERTIRVPQKKRIRLQSEELKLFEREKNRIINKYKNQTNPQLAVMTRLRQLASSMPAFMMGKNKEEESWEWPYEDSKFNVLEDIFYEVISEHDKKLIVFAYYKDTLKYLKYRADRLGINSRIIHGGNSQERSTCLKEFRDDPDVKVLFSSQVGAEGIDLQFCDALVNYDLPWNPMVVEQRIGRIDRIGQDSDKIHIYNLVVANSIEEYIYDRLLQKIKVFEESLGDLESILSDGEEWTEKFKQLEYELYTSELTDREKKERIEQTRKALLNRKYDLEHIEKELTDVLVNDSHFKNEINRMISNRRYVTEGDLLSYLQSLIRHHLSFVNLENSNGELYKLWLNKSHKSELLEFIEQYINRAQNNRRNVLERMYFEFKRKLLNSNELFLTFDQEKAFRDKNLEYISSYHPLIYAATRYFEEESIEFNNAFRFSVPAEEFKEITIDYGHYLMVLGHITVERKFMGESREFHYLHPIVADLNQQDLTLFDDDQAEKFAALCREAATIFKGADSLPPAIIDPIRNSVLERMDRQKESLKKDESDRQESLYNRMNKQLESYYDYQISVRKKRLSEGKGIEAVLQNEIERLSREYDTRIGKLEESFVKASMTEESVSHIYVY